MAIDTRGAIAAGGSGTIVQVSGIGTEIRYLNAVIDMIGRGTDGSVTGNRGAVTGITSIIGAKYSSIVDVSPVGSGGDGTEGRAGRAAMTGGALIAEGSTPLGGYLRICEST